MPSIIRIVVYDELMDIIPNYQKTNSRDNANDQSNHHQDVLNKYPSFYRLLFRFLFASIRLCLASFDPLVSTPWL